MSQLDQPNVSEPVETAGPADGLGPVPPDNRPGNHPGEATDRPDPDAFRERFGGGDDAPDDAESPSTNATGRDRPADTGGPGSAAPLMASDAPPGSLLTLPLRTTAGALRLTADFMSGLARRIDDRRR